MTTIDDLIDSAATVASYTTDSPNGAIIHSIVMSDGTLITAFIMSIQTPQEQIDEAQAEIDAAQAIVDAKTAQMNTTASNYHIKPSPPLLGKPK